jgi:hypothetical protein
MTTFASGVAKKLAIKKETTWGTAAGASGSRYLRRVESSLALSKDTYQSQEIRADFQVADYRHGVRRVGGDIKGEVSLGGYDLLMAAALRRDFAAGGSYTAAAGDGITADSATKTFTRAGGGGGSWIDDGFRVGQIVRFASLAETANNGVNFRITALTATVMTVAEAVATDAVADESCTCAAVGKVSFIPTSGHTSDSFTVEHDFSDIDVSRLFIGCVVGRMALDLPATGMAGVTFSLTGKDAQALEAASAPYFTTPTAAGTGAVLAAVGGTLRLGGSDVAVVTGAQLTLDLGVSGDPVVGSNTLPALFRGRSTVSGQLTAYLEDNGLFSDFVAESELELHLMMTDTASPAGFVSLFLPRIKLGGSSENDGEKGIVQTLPFQALLKPDTTGYDGTTLMIQDSSL